MAFTMTFLDTPRLTRLSRREVIAALAALGTCAVSGARAAPATRLQDGAIDVHQHFFPQFFLDAWDAAAAATNDPVLPLVRQWSAERALERMALHGVSTAVLSMSSRPFMSSLPSAELRGLARRSNEFVAELSAQHRGRFALFATLPMPDIEGSLLEVGHALDKLGAVGVGLMTSYGDRWPGDPQFAPLLDELNRRSAVVFVHPLAPNCCGNLMPHVSTAETGILEYPYDTGRAVVSLLLSGSLVRYPKIRWIFCHAGGPIPVLAGRMRNLPRGYIDRLQEVAPNGIDVELRKLHYDTAQSTFAPTMAALMAYVAPTQVLFGTDYPYASLEATQQGLQELGYAAPLLQQIRRANALRLFPTLAQ